jgi:hypothetical protein
MNVTGVSQFEVPPAQKVTTKCKVAAPRGTVECPHAHQCPHETKMGGGAVEGPMLPDPSSAPFSGSVKPEHTLCQLLSSEVRVP